MISRGKRLLVLLLQLLPKWHDVDMLILAHARIPSQYPYLVIKVFRNMVVARVGWGALHLRPNPCEFLRIQDMHVVEDLLRRTTPPAEYAYVSMDYVIIGYYSLL